MGCRLGLANSVQISILPNLSCRLKFNKEGNVLAKTRVEFFASRSATLGKAAGRGLL